MMRNHLPFFYQVANFGLIGMLVSSVNIGIYWGCKQLLNFNPNVAWFFGFAVAVVLGYVLQSRFVFNTRGDAALLTAGGRYLSVALLALAINSAWVWLTVSHAHLPIWAPLPLAIFVTPAITFCLNRFYVFR